MRKKKFFLIDAFFCSISEMSSDDSNLSILNGIYNDEKEEEELMIKACKMVEDHIAIDAKVIKFHPKSGKNVSMEKSFEVAWRNDVENDTDSYVFTSKVITFDLPITIQVNTTTALNFLIFLLRLIMFFFKYYLGVRNQKLWNIY